MTVVTERATLDELREFCNVVRNAGAANPLDALLEAIPEEPSECLIARNLNFSCEVNGCGQLASQFDADLLEKFGHGSDIVTQERTAWTMQLKDRDLANKIAEAISSDVAVSTFTSRFDDETVESTYHVLLPRKISLVAEEFDRAYSDGPYEEAVDAELISLMTHTSKYNLADTIVENDIYNEGIEVDPGVREVLSDMIKEIKQERLETAQEATV